MWDQQFMLSHDQRDDILKAVQAIERQLKELDQKPRCPRRTGKTMTFGKTTPILRSFDEAKAREFYVGFLGFKVDWEHRFEPDTPLYMQVSRDGCVLHLSEHH